jgi:hypothetical protein
MEPQRVAVAVFMAVTFAFLTLVLIAVDWAAATVGYPHQVPQGLVVHHSGPDISRTPACATG